MFSLLWGWLADKINNHWSMMAVGLAVSTASLLVLGPTPYLTDRPKWVWTYFELNNVFRLYIYFNGDTGVGYSVPRNGESPPPQSLLTLISCVSLFPLTYSKLKLGFSYFMSFSQVWFVFFGMSVWSTACSLCYTINKDSDSLKLLSVFLLTQAMKTKA